MRGCFGLGAGVLSVWLGAVPPAGAAQEVSDPATGFVVLLPQGMSAERMERPDQTVTFAVRSARSMPRLPPTSAHLCQVGYRDAPQNASLSQEDINAMSLDRARQEGVRATVGQAFRIQALEPFGLRGARGLEIVGTPLAGPGAEEVRVVLSLLETPLGRLTMSCATQAVDLAPGLQVIRELRDGVRLPDEGRKP